MRIGLDLDNTLVCYDHVFALESKKLGIVASSWAGSKQELKDELQLRPNGERLWQTLQGRVYGPGMGQALMFPGVASFLMRSRGRGDDLFIVSHKTEFGHFDSTKTPLRAAAICWMESIGFFDQNRFGLAEGNVFFEGTRSEKVERISCLNLDIFIDDLEEVFEGEGFPPIKKVLFNAKAKRNSYDLHCTDWSEIGRHIFGPLRDTECKQLVQSICPEQIESVTQLSGRGNSRIYRVTNNSGGAYALKFYPDLSIDPRLRLRSEVTACNFLKHLCLTPRCVAHDEELNLALFEWIDGESPDPIKTSHVDQALTFVQKLKELSEGADKKFPEASEACLSRAQLVAQVGEKIKKLDSVEDKDLQNYLEHSIKPLSE